ncbi:hypothetical protein BRADI_4g40035v3 [Brachypodium distachyon]|uniref:Uncharacterized protein n=1 Tax=Brachypodium distachyon TaxID=15368 RepID=A0A2K2CTE9_BRADI|nr:hypothetical protein BRADI_4g40035v3 [Brachypodium distachyon]
MQTRPSASLSSPSLPSFPHFSLSPVLSTGMPHVYRHGKVDETKILSIRS